jgi:hypothetical protein
VADVETLGDPFSAGWRITMRCLDDSREGLKHKRRYGSRTELDLKSLVATRGRDFPIARIAERLRCPQCGCRHVGMIFSPPAGAAGGVRIY